MSESKVLAKSLQSAKLGVLSTVFFRFFTFFVNAYILRHVTRDVLGIGVRTTLLHDTVIFLSREAFRKACLSKPEDGNWRGTINLIWLSLPIGSLCSLLLGYLWLHHLELPSDPEVASQYASAVRTIPLNSLLTLASEPFYVVGQAYLHVGFSSFAQLFQSCSFCVLQCLVVTVAAERAVVLAAWAGVLSALLHLVANVVYFQHQISKKKKDDDDESIPFDSILEFLPDLSSYRIDPGRFALSLSFFKQGFLKQLLTEGEKYMFTWFALMSLPEQGIYDVIANLGSIPARMFFVKLEDSSHLYFSQTVTRGPGADVAREEGPSRYLGLLLRALVLLGLVVCAFGVSYSHLLLHLYGGEILSGGVGPSLLRAHCFYILFLAVNGISECYAFSVLTDHEVAGYNYLMALMTAAFLALTWVLSRALGPVGFTVANCCNFAMRIVHNFGVIARRHEAAEVKPHRGLLPGKVTLSVIALSGLACRFSELYVYDTDLKHIVMHVGIGAVMFLATLGTIVLRESYVNEYVRRKIKRE